VKINKMMIDSYKNADSEIVIAESNTKLDD